jgi:hypothetical protein
MRVASTPVIKRWLTMNELSTAIPNSERIYFVSPDQVPSVELDLNHKSRVSGSKNFEFGIAELSTIALNAISISVKPLPHSLLA